MDSSTIIAHRLLNEWAATHPSSSGHDFYQWLSDIHPVTLESLPMFQDSDISCRGCKISQSWWPRVFCSSGYCSEKCQTTAAQRLTDKFLDWIARSSPCNVQAFWKTIESGDDFYKYINHSLPDIDRHNFSMFQKKWSQDDLDFCCSNCAILNSWWPRPFYSTPVRVHGRTLQDSYCSEKCSTAHHPSVSTPGGMVHQ